MSINRVIETVFTLIMLLFLAIIVLAVLIGISIFQELSGLEVGFAGKFIFIFGMFLTFAFILKLFVDKIRDYNRYSND